MTPLRARSFAIVGVTYAVALAAALLVGASLHDAHPLLVIAAADLAATLVVFAASAWFRCASIYDPFWSIAPLAIAGYWVLSTGGDLRSVMVLALIWIWGLRLTFNFLRGWSGIDHEDWRYVDLRASSGRLFPLVNLFGIHLLPTGWVYLGCLPLMGVMTSERPLGWLDAPGLLIMVGAIALEARADATLREFRETPGRRLTDVLDTGVWGWCRHPNYLGEMGLWWGLWLVCLAAAPSLWWTGVGALSIYVLFRYISTPMIDRRHLVRRPDYARLMLELPSFLPRFSARSSESP
jgi:steroid 5-alpha reductase family enzyme